MSRKRSALSLALLSLFAASNVSAMKYAKKIYNKFCDYKFEQVDNQVLKMNEKFDSYTNEKLAFKKIYSEMKPLIEKKEKLEKSYDENWRESNRIRDHLLLLNLNYNEQHRNLIYALAARNKQWKTFCKYAEKNIFWLLMAKPELSYGMENTNCDVLASNELKETTEKLLMKYPEKLVLEGFDTMFFDREDHLPYSLKKTFPEVFDRCARIKKQYKEFAFFDSV